MSQACSLNTLPFNQPGKCSKTNPEIWLMEEILHQLTWWISHDSQGFFTSQVQDFWTINIMVWYFHGFSMFFFQICTTNQRLVTQLPSLRKPISVDQKPRKGWERLHIKTLQKYRSVYTIWICIYIYRIYYIYIIYRYMICISMIISNKGSHVFLHDGFISAVYNPNSTAIQLSGELLWTKAPWHILQSKVSPFKKGTFEKILHQFLSMFYKGA